MHGERLHGVEIRLVKLGGCRVTLGWIAEVGQYVYIYIYTFFLHRSINASDVKGEKHAFRLSTLLCHAYIYRGTTSGC